MPEGSQQPLQRAALSCCASVCRLTAALDIHKRGREGKCRLHTSDDCYLLSANIRYRQRLSTVVPPAVVAGQSDRHDGQVTRGEGLMLLNMVSRRTRVVGL